MRYMLVSVIAALCCIFAVPAALADGDYKQCKVGDRVQDRDNNLGTVVRLDPTDKYYCFVQKDGEADSHIAPAFMLRLAGHSIDDQIQTDSIKFGRYTCYAGTQIIGHIIIRSGSLYTDTDGHPGKYIYDSASKSITFQSGSYVGDFAKYRHVGEISLSLKPITPTTLFSAVCDLPK